MKLLLDTHVFIWLVEGDNRLSKAVSDAVADPRVKLILSVGSIWEMAIKVNGGKLRLADSVDLYVDRWLTYYEIEVLPIHKLHAFSAAKLPLHHRDPFDRLLIAQALCEQALLASGDAIFGRYAAPLLW